MENRQYHHLSADERDQLSVLKAQGRSINEIGRILHRSGSTISRELRRNNPPVRKGYYLSHKANERAVHRKSSAHQRARLKNHIIRHYVENGLTLLWTPEQIAGRLPMEHLGQSISHEAIYQYIYKERSDLIEYLPRHHKKRLKRGHSRKHRKCHIPNRVSIEDRPAEVAKRQETGHWESDTLGSRKSKAALVVSVERKSRFAVLSKLEQKTAQGTKDSIVHRLRPFPKHLRRSITYDNGSENTLHEDVNDILGTASYFCHPYASWEKGTVENANGLVRRFFPKKTDFANVSDHHINFVEFLLNNRPRKCLHYQTPLEVISHCVALKG
jgi:IS30 family transposase